MSSPATKSEVVAIFRTALGREPSTQEIDSHVEQTDVVNLLSTVTDSAEARIYNVNKMNAYYFPYNSKIDAVEIVLRHQDKSAKARADRLVNYLGVVIDPAYLPKILEGKRGQVEDVPIPANWHADLAEFAAALRAVDLANDTFRMIELGCGWGCWLLNTGVAARRQGMKVELVGAEADPGHAAFARQGCMENGFKPDEAKILRRIVGPVSGEALFPKQEAAGHHWGLEPIFKPTPQQLDDARRNNNYEVLPIITFDDLTPDGSPIDLLHMDIQGGEADFLAECIDAMDRLVAYLVVGTHSRSLEGRIFHTMLAHGWILEVERAARLDLGELTPHTTVDGIQGWRNPRLRPL